LAQALKVAVIAPIETENLARHFEPKRSLPIIGGGHAFPAAV
jgi:hypothetical protein